MPDLLLADDDRELSVMLSEYLVGDGFRVKTETDGECALKMALAKDFDLLVLDVMMPGMNGFDVLHALRAKKQTPVLMLTARGDDVDSIVGLEMGADDYLAKPCNPRILAARIRAILRRGTGSVGGVGYPQVLQQADLALHTGQRTVHVGDTLIAMTSTEFSILDVLMREAGSVVSKDDLSTRALGRALSRFDRSLDMHVCNLRHKIGPLADGRERILTVRGVGYQFICS